MVTRKAMIIFARVRCVNVTIENFYKSKQVKTKNIRNILTLLIIFKYFKGIFFVFV